MTIHDAASRAPDLVAQTLDRHRPIVVLASHPGDQTPGCGGLLARAFAGHGAHVVLMTDGPDLPVPDPEAAIRELGGTRADITRLCHKASGLGDPSVPVLSIARTIAAHMSRLRARCLFAPAPTDPHCDRKATAEIARLAARLTAARLFYYPVWTRWSRPHVRSQLPDMPEYRLDTLCVRDRKARAMAAQPGGHDPAHDPGTLRRFIETDEIFFEDRFP